MARRRETTGEGVGLRTERYHVLGHEREQLRYERALKPLELALQLRRQFTDRFGVRCGHTQSR